ncbi:MAG TPA: DsbA family protein [Solirubrobacterales bacterium]|jgi:protein-disulfide isomerase|nr:DsbA family protein [Solirubrobacterales bacterium]
MTELTSSAVPPLDADDHVAGEGPEAIVYADFGCPHCAAVWARIRGLPLRLCLRHFPMAAKHPRAPALHAAAEAAGLQGAFWEMADSLFAERGRVDDPHLWERVEHFGLDLERFNSDRPSERVAARVRRDFESGIRAGVSGTPTAFVAGRPVRDGFEDALARLASLASGPRGP